MQSTIISHTAQGTQLTAGPRSAISLAFQKGGALVAIPESSLLPGRRCGIRGLGVWGRGGGGRGLTVIQLEVEARWYPRSVLPTKGATSQTQLLTFHFIKTE